MLEWLDISVMKGLVLLPGSNMKKYFVPTKVVGHNRPNAKVLETNISLINMSLVSADACPALPSFVSGERILQFGDGIGFGSVFQFHCAKGYFIEGPLSIVCRPNGEWSSPQPLCKSKPF